MNIATTVSRRSFFGATLAAGAGLCLSPALAFGVTSEEKRAEAEATLAQLNAMQEELDIASNNYFTAVAEQESAQKKMEEAQVRIDEATKRIAEVQAQLGTRARTMYRTGASSVIDLILGATSFAEFAQSWEMLSKLNQNDADMVQESKDLRTEIEAQKKEYEQQEKLAAEKAGEALRIKQDAEATVAEMQTIYNNLSEEAAALLAEEQAAQAAAEAAAAAAVVEAATSDSSASYNNSYTGVADAGSVTGRAYSYIGNAEYVWGACSPGAFDCSGFVSYCLTGAYSRLGTTYTFLGWTQVSDPQPGDVCVNEGHCGIYVGGGQMVHAATYGVGVIQGPVQSGMIFVRW